MTGGLWSKAGPTPQQDPHPDSDVSPQAEESSSLNGFLCPIKFRNSVPVPSPLLRWDCTC